MQRRQLIQLCAATLTALALPAHAQQAQRIRRIGWLSGGSATSTADWMTAFRQGMTALQWNEGRDYTIDTRNANGNGTALPALADALIATQPDLFMTPGDEGARLLLQKTKTIPIVFALMQGDPLVIAGAASLRRPGGNATGLVSQSIELAAQRLQLLKEALPRLSHVVVLRDTDISAESQLKQLEIAAKQLRIRITAITLAQPADIEPALKRAASIGAQACLVTGGFFNATHSAAINDASARNKVPLVGGTPRSVELGAIMAYAPSSADNFRRAAGYVDKILKGAKPGDLPIEQPTKFELVLNLKTAKTMGITFPKTILSRADRIIE